MTRVAPDSIERMVSVSPPPAGVGLPRGPPAPIERMGSVTPRPAMLVVYETERPSGDHCGSPTRPVTAGVNDRAGPTTLPERGLSVATKIWRAPVCTV